VSRTAWLYSSEDVWHGYGLQMWWLWVIPIMANLLDSSVPITAKGRYNSLIYQSQAFHWITKGNVCPPPYGIEDSLCKV
jgi:hypothetical protein